MSKKLCQRYLFNAFFLVLLIPYAGLWSDLQFMVLPVMNCLLLLSTNKNKVRIPKEIIALLVFGFFAVFSFLWANDVSVVWREGLFWFNLCSFVLLFFIYKENNAEALRDIKFMLRISAVLYFISVSYTHLTLPTILRV